MYARPIFVCIEAPCYYLVDDNLIRGRKDLVSLGSLLCRLQCTLLCTNAASELLLVFFGLREEEYPLVFVKGNCPNSLLMVKPHCLWTALFPQT